MTVKSMRTAVPPPPGSLVLLNDENPYLAGAVGLVVTDNRWTDTDYMGRPYVWVNLPTVVESRGVVQIPQTYIRTVLSTPSDLGGGE